MSQPRQRRKIRWKNLVILLVAFALVLYLFISLIGLVVSKISNSSDTFTACKLSTSSLRKKTVGKEYEGTVEMMDYVFYGEHLSLYSDTYSVGSSSAYVGKTIILKNLCNGKSITIEKTTDYLDGQIDLRSLPTGLYEVYVVENLLEKRLYTTSAIATTNTFYTVARNGSRNKVTVYSDASLFNAKNAKENSLDRNYVFIDVRSEKVADTVYDIVLNPGPVAIDNTYSSTGNGLDETSEMYRVALAVQKKLTNDGYKVLISRGNYDWVSTYGTSGTASKGYNSGAKYFISFDLYENETITGVGVDYSSYTTNDFANIIYNKLIAAGLTGQYGERSVVASDTEGVYDIDFDIRETGGKALGAGMINDRSKNDNSYASDLNGMQAIYIQLCNVNSADDVANYKANYDKTIDALVSGIEEYLK